MIKIIEDEDCPKDQAILIDPRYALSVDVDGNRIEVFKKHKILGEIKLEKE